MVEGQSVIHILFFKAALTHQRLYTPLSSKTSTTCHFRCPPPPRDVLSCSTTRRSSAGRQAGALQPIGGERGRETQGGCLWLPAESPRSKESRRKSVRNGEGSARVVAPSCGTGRESAARTREPDARSPVHSLFRRC